jgi:uncharacterized membrane protein
MTDFIAAKATSMAEKRKRIESIDLLRGIVMIIMALDHVRDYFHRDAFLYDPADLSQTNALLFFTRFITHYCAPVFVFLAGISAYLYGAKKSKAELAFYLLTRGIWLVLVELFILSLFRTFNPAFVYFNLQVIWAIGISMIFLAAVIYLNKSLVLLTGILLIAAHNLLDKVHVPGNDTSSFLWSLIHDTGYFTFGQATVHVHYPLLPWLGIITTGYYMGHLYAPGYDAVKRIKTLLTIGFGSVLLFFILRSGNFYGDAAHWSLQKNSLFSFFSFINVTKYPPSLLYTLVTLGPAFIFLAIAEKKPLNGLTTKIIVFGRVPMFYYLAHILLIHILASIGAVLTGYKWSDMVLSTNVNRALSLKGYGFNLMVVYLVWVGLVLMLYPFCKWFGRYKRTHQLSKRWLTYL